MGTTVRDGSRCRPEYLCFGSRAHAYMYVKQGGHVLSVNFFFVSSARVYKGGGCGRPPSTLKSF